jgi:hypothetical protein
MKNCSKCSKPYPPEHYKKQSNICRPCINEGQRAYRKATTNDCTYKYEKSRQGFLMRLYRNMQSRVTGVQKAKHHLYEGKTLLARDTFYSWANTSIEFEVLFQAWEVSDYDRKLTPSVDRINSVLGYEVGNMEWVTHSENSRRGVISKNEQRKVK